MECRRKFYTPAEDDGFLVQLGLKVNPERFSLAIPGCTNIGWQNSSMSFLNNLASELEVKSILNVPHRMRTLEETEQVPADRLATDVIDLPILNSASSVTYATLPEKDLVARIIYAENTHKDLLRLLLEIFRSHILLRVPDDGKELSLESLLFLNQMAHELGDNGIAFRPIKTLAVASPYHVGIAFGIRA